MSLYEVGTMDEAVHAVRGDCSLAVVTVGADGCLVVTPDDVLHAPAQPVDHVLDTTGAGDSFNAGFLRAWLDRADLKECLRWGAVCGAISTRSLGGIDAQPTLPAVRAALASWSNGVAG